MKYQSEIDSALEIRDEISNIFKKLSKKKHNKVDQVFHELHEEAFEKIDCLECGNCCKTTSPIFRDIDAKRISKKLKLSQAQFEKEYLRKDSDGDWVLNSAPCPFLGVDNHCFIYDFRPQACREYPHTNRKRMIAVLDLTLKNMEICPAVAKIVKQIPEKFI